MKKISKKFLAFILFIFIFTSSVVSSIFVGEPIEVKAANDSNTYRQLLINAAAGMQTSQFEELGFGSTYDIDSIRAISLFLSNFYSPFSSILDDTKTVSVSEDDNDIETTNDKASSTAKRGDTTAFKSEMKKALVSVGMDGDVASTFVDACVRATLSTAKQLYVKREVADAIFNKTNNQAGLRSHKVSAQSIALKGSLTNDDYWSHLGIKNDKNGNQYVAVSYALFLQIMSYAKEISTDEKYSNGSGYKHAAKFYWFNENNKAIPVFSTSEECYKAYCMYNDELNYNQGIGSALLSVNADGLSDLADKDLSVARSVMATEQLMYVDWVGDLIIDNKVNRYIAFPGCGNPYTLTRIKSEDNKNYEIIDSVNAINIRAASLIQDDKLTGDDSSSTLKVAHNDKSLMTVKLWRCNVGSSEYNFDQSSMIGKGWGDYQVLYNILHDKSEQNIYTSSASVQNSAAFPRFDGGYWGSVSGKNFVFNASPFFTSILHPDTLTPMSVSSASTDYFKTQSVYDYASSSGAVNFKDVTDYNDAVTYDGSQDLLTDLFITYAFAEFNCESTSYKEKNNLIDLKFNKSIFPSATGQIEFETFSADTMPAKVLSLVYYFLHPSKGGLYVATAIKKIVTSTLLKWHDDVVGGTDSNYTTGMTKYLGIEGYVTIPNLYDISWIANILDMYNNLIVFLIMLVVIILVCFVLAGELTFTRALLGFLMFSTLAFIPPLAINAVVNISNKVNDQIYMNKFDYWAITQLETYATSLSQFTRTAGATSIESEEDTVSDSADKLDVIQTETASSSNSIVDAYNEDEAKQFNFSTSDNQAGLGNKQGTGYTGVKLKWMTPKKYLNGLMAKSQLDNTSATTTKATALKSFVINSVANNTDGQSFILDDPNALYVYRDYTDIYRYASTSYNLYTTYNCDGALSIDNSGLSCTVEHFNINPNGGSNTVGNNWNSSYCQLNYLENITTGCGLPLSDFIDINLGGSYGGDLYDLSSRNHVARGFLFNNFSDGTDFESTDYYRKKKTLAVSLLANFANTTARVEKGLINLENFAQIGDNGVSKSDLKSGNVLFGLPLGSFANTVQNFAVLDKEAGFINDSIKDSHKLLNSSNTDDGKCQYKRLSDYYYALYSESPFYFLSFNIQDQMRNSTKYKFNDKDRTASSGHVKGLLLKEDQEYFFNYDEDAEDGYGELRDFTNMHDLFYYIMPMMKPSSDLIRSFDEKYGMYTYDSCSLKLNSDGTLHYNAKDYDSISKIPDSVWDKMTEQDMYEFWHDYNVYTILNAYCPWYDAMTDCNYAKPETIRIGETKFEVKNPLDPTSYFELDSSGSIINGREMIFSRSEQSYFGLLDSDLTSVEKKILEFQDNVYKKSIELMNYYTLSDDTLINALAMIELFEFNKIFSQDSIVGGSYQLYPTGYELKAFSYDAYLRLIIAEQSGEDVATQLDNSDSESYNKSIYTRVQENTSIFFSIFLLLNDLVAVYAIPGLKLFFVIIIFFLGVAVLVSAVVQLDLNLPSVLYKAFLAPLVTFGLISIALGVVTSMFMSNGASGVTGDNNVINLGDPVMALIAMFILNICALIAYYKICHKLVINMKTVTKVLANSIGGAISGAFNNVASFMSGGRVGTPGGSNTNIYNNEVAGMGTPIDRINNRGGVSGTQTKDSVSSEGSGYTERRNSALQPNQNITNSTQNQSSTSNSSEYYDSRSNETNASQVTTNSSSRDMINSQNTSNDNRSNSSSINNSGSINDSYNNRANNITGSYNDNRRSVTNSNESNYDVDFKYKNRDQSKVSNVNNNNNYPYNYSKTRKSNTNVYNTRVDDATNRYYSDNRVNNVTNKNTSNSSIVNANNSSVVTNSSNTTNNMNSSSNVNRTSNTNTTNNATIHAENRSTSGSQARARGRKNRNNINKNRNTGNTRGI